jgi:hypothetical protein
LSVSFAFFVRRFNAWLDARYCPSISRVSNGNKVAAGPEGDEVVSGPFRSSVTQLDDDGT